nr:hypothetical protein [Tanacetum cinerariifolium]
MVVSLGENLVYLFWVARVTLLGPVIVGCCYVNWWVHLLICSCCVRWTDSRVQESLDSATSTNVLLVCKSFDLWTDFVAIDGVDVIFELIRILAGQILRFAAMAG